MSFGPNDVELTRYIEEVRRIPLLDRDEEHRLAVAAAAGDGEARAALIRANVRFVIAVALKYRRYAIRLGDLIAEGNLGLMIAAEKFDPHRGTRFVTYASYWIRAMILDLVVRSASLVGGGSGPLRSKLYFRLRRERARYEGMSLDAETRTALLARHFETTSEKIDEMLQRLDAKDVSLDQAARADAATTLLDSIPSDEPSVEARLVERETMDTAHRRLHAALNELDARERYIVEQRFMREEEASLASIGRTLGVSRERARQLEARAKQKLRSQLQDLALDLVA